MSHLTRYSSCIVCDSRSLSEIAGPDQMAMEVVHRERLFRELYPPETPSYMLKDRAFPTQTYDARLLACDECGTLARDPHLSALGAIEEYAEDSYHPRWLETSFQEFHAAFSARMPELVRFVGPKARVLEIGSYVGGFLAAAEEHGWRAKGVDVGACVTSFARSKGLEVHNGRLAETGFSDGSFDAVFVWSCFDQLVSPWQDLREIHRILDDRGRLVIRVPNGSFVRWMHRVECGAPIDTARDLVRRILAFAGLAGFPFQVGYTPSSLRAMLRDSGFGSIHVRNQINLRGLDPERASFFSVPAATKTLRAVHAGSQLLHLATLGSLSYGPWIEVSCSKVLTSCGSSRPALASSRFHFPDSPYIGIQSNTPQLAHRG